jgi:hypothetical protein
MSPVEMDGRALHGSCEDRARQSCQTLTWDPEEEKPPSATANWQEQKRIILALEERLLFLGISLADDVDGMTS